MCSSDLARIFFPVRSVKRLCSRNARRESDGGMSENLLLHHSKIDSSKKASGSVHFQGVIVGVGDALRHAQGPAQPQNKATKMMDMAVDHIVGAVLPDEAVEIPCVNPWLTRMRARQDPSPETSDFLVISALPIVVHQKVEMKPIAVDSSQYMHQPGFDATAVHAPYNMEDSQR